jgi:hypothetical protein
MISQGGEAEHDEEFKEAPRGFFAIPADGQEDGGDQEDMNPIDPCGFAGREFTPSTEGMVGEDADS